MKLGIWAPLNILDPSEWAESKQKATCLEFNLPTFPGLWAESWWANSFVSVDNNRHLYTFVFGTSDLMHSALWCTLIIVDSILFCLDFCIPSWESDESVWALVYSTCLDASGHLGCHVLQLYSQVSLCGFRLEFRIKHVSKTQVTRTYLLMLVMEFKSPHLNCIQFEKCCTPFERCLVEP